MQDYGGAEPPATQIAAYEDRTQNLSIIALPTELTDMILYSSYYIVFLADAMLRQ